MGALNDLWRTMLHKQKRARRGSGPTSSATEAGRETAAAAAPQPRPQRRRSNGGRRLTAGLLEKGVRSPTAGPLGLAGRERDRTGA